MNLHQYKLIYRYNYSKILQQKIGNFVKNSIC